MLKLVGFLRSLHEVSYEPWNFQFKMEQLNTFAERQNAEKGCTHI
jgi:hypothetical protein